MQANLSPRKLDVPRYEPPRELIQDFFDSTYGKFSLYEKLRPLIDPLELSPITANKIFHPWVQRTTAVELDLTDYCQLNCPKCAYGHVRKPNSRDIGLEELRFLARVFRERAAVRGVILVGGGEPTLWGPTRSELGQALACFAGFHTGLITNGFTIPDGVAHAILEFCDFVRVSYPENPKIATEVKKNVQKLLQLRGSLPSKCRISIGILVDPSNDVGLDHIENVLTGLDGLDSVQLRPMQCHRDDSLELTSDEISMTLTSNLETLRNDRRWKFNISDFIESLFAYRTSHKEGVCSIVQDVSTLKVRGSNGIFLCDQRATKTSEHAVWRFGDPEERLRQWLEEGGPDILLDACGACRFTKSNFRLKWFSRLDVEQQESVTTWATSVRPWPDIYFL